MKSNVSLRDPLSLLALLLTLLTVTARSEDVFTPIDIQQVKVQGLIGRRIDATINNNVLAIDINKDFLKPFQKRTVKIGFIGLGMHLDSLVHFAAYSQTEKVLKLKKRVVAEIIKTQDADGYVGIMLPEARIWKLWDVHEMAYLIHGLTADYRYFGEERSLKAARGIADYIIRRWSAEPKRHPSDSRHQGQLADQLAVLGLDTAMLALHHQTGDHRYFKFCTEFLKIREWDAPIVLGRSGPVAGQATAFLSRSLAQLLIHRTQPDEALLKQSRKAFDFLTRKNGLVITGACGVHECWHDTQTGTGKLGETCTTAYLIRWLDNWLRLDGNVQRGDIMERSIYNALFAAQSPDGRSLRYYSPFEGARKYYDTDTYCCTNNFRRIISELPGMIYYRSDKGVMVNLYASSTVDLKLDDGVSLNLRQETDYPNTGKVLLHVEPSQPTSFPLKLRVPQWCDEASVSINGKVHRTSKPGFVTIDRMWKAGDRIELSLPMPWRFVKGRASQAGRVAVMRGPILFALNLKQHPELTSADLEDLVIVPSSLEEPFKEVSIRPDGIAGKIKAWVPDTTSKTGKRELTLTLSEFPDPDGVAVYFNIPEQERGFVEDDDIVGNK